MTVSTTSNQISHIGDAVTTIFPYDFLVFEEGHLNVLFDGELQVGGFTISGLNQQNGGDVTFDVAPATGIDIDIIRLVPLTQEIDYTAFDPFPAETHERGLDLGVMRDQQSEAGTDRSLHIPVDDPLSIITEFPNAATRADHTIFLDT